MYYLKGKSIYNIILGGSQRNPVLQYFYIHFKIQLPLKHFNVLSKSITKMLEKFTF